MRFIETIMEKEINQVKTRLNLYSNNKMCSLNVDDITYLMHYTKGYKTNKIVLDTTFPP